MRFDSPRKRRLRALLIATLILAGGCGQRGPLVLPGSRPASVSSENQEDTQQDPEDDESETDSER